MIKTKTKILCIVLVSVMSLTLITISKSRKDQTPCDNKEIIGIFVSFSHPCFDECIESFKTTLSLKKSVEFDIQNAENSLDKARKISRYYHTNKKIQTIFTIAPLATKTMSQIENKKNIIFSAIHDASSLNLYKSNVNVYGIEDKLDSRSILSTAQTLCNASNPMICYLKTDSPFSLSILGDIENRQSSESMLIKKIYFKESEKEDLEDALPSGASSVLFLPLDIVIQKNIDCIIRQTESKKIPIITEDKTLLDHSICVSYNTDFHKTGEKAAELTHLILECASESDIQNSMMCPIPQVMTQKKDVIESLGLQNVHIEQPTILSISSFNTIETSLED